MGNSNAYNPFVEGYFGLGYVSVRYMLLVLICLNQKLLIYTAVYWGLRLQ